MYYKLKKTKSSNPVKVKKNAVEFPSSFKEGMLAFFRNFKKLHMNNLVTEKYLALSCYHLIQGFKHCLSSECNWGCESYVRRTPCYMCICAILSVYFKIDHKFIAIYCLVAYMLIENHKWAENRTVKWDMLSSPEWHHSYIHHHEYSRKWQITPCRSCTVSQVGCWAQDPTAGHGGNCKIWQKRWPEQEG